MINMRSELRDFPPPALPNSRPPARIGRGSITVWNLALTFGNGPGVLVQRLLSGRSFSRIRGRKLVRESGTIAVRTEACSGSTVCNRSLTISSRDEESREGDDGGPRRSQPSNRG